MWPCRVEPAHFRASHFFEELVDVGSESLQVVEQHAHLQESHDSHMTVVCHTIHTHYLEISRVLGDGDGYLIDVELYDIDNDLEAVSNM